MLAALNADEQGAAHSFSARIASESAFPNVFPFFPVRTFR